MSVVLAAAVSGTGCWSSGDDCSDVPPCEGKVLRTCDGASYITSQECEGTCVALPGHSPFCALDDKRDAVCEGNPYYPVCDGTALVECHAGYATKRRECAASPGAMLPPESTVTCVRYPFMADGCYTLGKPDPRCDATSEVSHFCDGPMRVNCYGPRPFTTQRCATIEDCVASADDDFCR
jgi:hypothetical protein